MGDIGVPAISLDDHHVMNILYLINLDQLNIIFCGISFFDKSRWLQKLGNFLGGQTHARSHEVSRVVDKLADRSS